jgi:hypothetical protein
MSQKVTPFMGGLGRDVTSKFEITDDASVTVGDGTNGGNVAVGDNGVISFGAGSDLQIYHDVSNSYIDEVGAGVLKIRSNGTGVDFESTGGETLAQFVTNGAVTLYHNNAEKLATTATGVDVTGDVQGDGLIIDGTFDLGALT